jgi:hypothetical protein
VFRSALAVAFTATRITARYARVVGSLSHAVIPEAMTSRENEDKDDGMERNHRIEQVGETGTPVQPNQHQSPDDGREDSSPQVNRSWHPVTDHTRIAALPDGITRVFPESKRRT